MERSNEINFVAVISGYNCNVRFKTVKIKIGDNTFREYCPPPLWNPNLIKGNKKHPNACHQMHFLGSKYAKTA